MFDHICETLHHEMTALDEKYSNGAQLSGQDLMDIREIASSLKNIATYEAMKGGRRMRYDRSGYPGEPENYDRRY